jgi:hypothetical protein
MTRETEHMEQPTPSVFKHGGKPRVRPRSNDLSEADGLEYFRVGSLERNRSRNNADL